MLTSSWPISAGDEMNCWNCGRRWGWKSNVETSVALLNALAMVVADANNLVIIPWAWVWDNVHCADCSGWWWVSVFIKRRANF